jgi:acyl CoA:acetate/3-ketoacid CoA transferase beta subunit
MSQAYTTNELMAVTASRRFVNSHTIFVGLGLPQVASRLAKATHAPDMNIIMEVGVYNPEPLPGVGLADPRLWYRSEYFTGLVGTLGEMLQKGLVDIGFLGALQIDRFGNLNSTQVTEDSKLRHFTGSGGAADIASLAKRVFVIMKHEKRKLIEKVEYLTSVGCYKGGKSRAENGLRPIDGVTVFTNLCVLETGAESGELEVKSIHPGVTAETLRENTGYDLAIPKNVPITDEPSQEELALLREQIDPHRMYIK